MYQDLPLLADAQAKNILAELCLQRGISVELVESLIEIQRDNLGKGMTSPVFLYQVKC